MSKEKDDLFIQLIDQHIERTKEQRNSIPPLLYVNTLVIAGVLKNKYIKAIKTSKDK